MTRPIRPVKSFVLRLWREPGAEDTQTEWRGSIRPLRARGAPEQEILFHSLEKLPERLRPLLSDGDPGNAKEPP